MKVHNLTIDSSQRDTTLYPHANNYVITLENPIYDIEEIRLISGRIPTPQTSPNSLVLRLSSGSDEFNQSVYMGTSNESSQKGTPHYTGHILLNGTTALTYNGADDPFVYRFHSGPQKIISELGIEFLYMNNGVLTSYNFSNNNHVLKFEIVCSTDKLEGLPKVPIKKDEDEEEEEEEEFISIPEVKNVYRFKEEYIYIASIVVVGLLLLFFMKGKPTRYPRTLSE